MDIIDQFFILKSLEFIFRSHVCEENFLIPPEGGSKEYKNCEKFKTAGEHDEGKNPFGSIRNVGVVALYAGYVGAESGIAYCAQGTEETVFQRQTQ